MTTALLIAFLLLTLIAAILHGVSYRKSDDMSTKAMLITLVAAILAGVALFLIDSGDTVAGGYVYYYNGVRMGAGVMSVGMNLFLAFMAFVVSHFVSVGIGYLFGHRRDAKEKGAPRGWVLLVSVLALFSGIGFFQSLSMFPNLTNVSRLHIIGLGIATWALGVWGIVDYIKKKKSSEK